MPRAPYTPPVTAAPDPRFPPPISTELARSLRARLLRWYRANARELPWRRDTDAYRVWISEAMLQQTRVETVIGYYERFLERFPDVRSLAAAPEEDVLAAWSGLGYYRRARSLREAAQVVVERHGGTFPATHDEVLALPGIGPYTAGAILSIAFDRSEPLVDGNVARVFCRWFGLDAEPGPALERELWSRAATLVPRRQGAGDWNQALMELGATLCKPREPACAGCPVRSSCVAQAEGRTEELPRKKPRREPDDVELELLLIVDRGRWLVQERPSSGRMAGLLELPTTERGSSGGAGLFPASYPEALERRIRPAETLGELRHGITHHRIRATLRRAEWLPGPAVRRPLRWIRIADLSDAPLTGMTKKVVRRFAGRPMQRGLPL